MFARSNLVMALSAALSIRADIAPILSGPEPDPGKRSIRSRARRNNGSRPVPGGGAKECARRRKQMARLYRDPAIEEGV